MKKLSKVLLKLREKEIIVSRDDEDIFTIGIKDGVTMIHPILPGEIKVTDELGFSGDPIEAKVSVLRSFPEIPGYQTEVIGEPGVINPEKLQKKKERTGITAVDRIDEYTRNKALAILVDDPTVHSKVIADKLGVEMWQIAGIKANLSAHRYPNTLLDRLRSQRRDPGLEE